MQLDSQRGAGLLEILVAVTAISVGAYLIVESSNTLRGLRFKSQESGAIAEVKRSMLQLVADTRSWEETIARNSGMACLRTGGPDCTSAQAQSFSIYDGSGRLILDSNAPSARRTIRGEPCTEYSEQGECPYRIEARWKPECTVPCASPEVSVTIVVHFTAPATVSAGGPSTESMPPIFRPAR